MLASHPLPGARRALTDRPLAALARWRPCDAAPTRRPPASA